jgi:putative restriction endonuclease
LEYDVPCFKILAANDTAAAPGHQGGIVIPKAIAEFFPALPAETGINNPTVDTEVEAELFVDGAYEGKVITRFQHQTWGGTRSPERRLTSNLTILRKAASAGDILLFQRSLDSSQQMRISLVRQGTELYKAISLQVEGRRYGALDETPIANPDFVAAELELSRLVENDFRLHGESIVRVTNRVSRIAREKSFQKLVLKNYDTSCAITGRRLFDSMGSNGIDAAHIVPLAAKGTNDVRNGLALSKELHWAFDKGLFGFRNRTLVVSNFIKKSAGNDYINSLQGTPLRSAQLPHLNARDEALNWHFSNIFDKTELND